MPAPQASLAHIEQLLSAMTLAEKIGQLTMSPAADVVTGPARAAELAAHIRAGTLGSVLNVVGSGPKSGAQACHELQRIALEESRLRIPLIFALDVMHGYRTLFPVSLAEAGLFDEGLWEMTAREAAAEAASAGISMSFAPMLDVARDPRWGRIVEGPGEDPWVGERMALAKVRGLQGQDLANPTSVAAVAKHFLGYGAVNAGREYASVDVSQRSLLEVHLPPFAAAVRAGVAAVMPAFHDLAGIPMTASREWLKGELRGRLGFTGVIVSDYNAIAELLQHGVAASAVEAAALALNASVDIDMAAGAYETGLPEALSRGLVTLEQIDAAVRRVLTLKLRLGLFADPYARGRTPERPQTVARRRALARHAAARSLVLLTCRSGILPLPTDLSSLAVLGPLADAAGEMRGPWHAAARPEDPVSLRAALSTLPIEVRHAVGVPIGSPTHDVSAGTTPEIEQGIAQALELARTARAILLCLGEAAHMSGEAASRAQLGLPGAQAQLARAVLAQARAQGEAAPSVIAVLFSGRPLTLEWLTAQADAVLWAGFPGSEAGPAILDVLTGRVPPTGRTAISWPRTVGQVPVFFAQRPTGRPAVAADGAAAPGYTSRYLDVPNEPLFAFGHGESYGRFACANLRVSPARCRPEDTVTVALDVSNAGPHAGEETIFVFTRERRASVARPLLSLRAVGRISLDSGERGSLSLTFPAAALSFLGPELTPVIEPGDIEILAGPSASRALLLSQTVQLLPQGAVH